MSKAIDKPEVSEELEALKAQLAEAEKGKAEAEAKVVEAEKGKAEAEAKAKAAEAEKAKPAVKAKVKAREIRVVSATRYSYLLDDENKTRVTPDAPVMVSLREGNLVHSHMEAGLIKEYV